MNLPRALVVFGLSLHLGLSAAAASSFRIDGPTDAADLAFGLSHLRAALTQHNFSETPRTKAHWSLRIELDPALPPQGFDLINPGDSRLTLRGVDHAGLTYGLLELAEQIRLYGVDHISTTTQSPAQLDRGVKFNISLDVRTPTYTEPSDAAQNALEQVWDRSFWFEYLDRLARQRYNLVSLWSLHPFPSMVRVPEYPSVALDDVRKSTVAWEENYRLQAIGLDAPEIVNNYEVLHRITIDDKIAFWREIMAYAKARHIKLYIVTWNIFVNGTDGKYGITDDITNPVTRDYFAKSVTAMFNTYPDLAGIGLTTGENMPGATFDEKEDWAFAAYGQGILDVARRNPDRQFTLIHRQHQTKARDIAQKFQPVIDAPNVNFLFSFKYAQAHVMSSTVQPFKDDFIQDIPPQKTLWTLRNDDNYLFRWGGADFVREFIQNIPADVSAGMYYGSDQWVWTREFLSTEPTTPRQLAFEKHWFHWLLWGRLAYQPDLDNQRLTALIQERFPALDAATLFSAWNDAAMIYPLTTGFHWGALDFQWYIEACQSQPGPAGTPNGFHDINRFISLPPHPGTNTLSIPEFVATELSQKPPTGVTPLQVSTELLRRSQSALHAANQIDPSGNPEIRQTLEDIRAQAYLGFYYGHKIRAATDLHFLRETLEGHYQMSMAQNLNQAAYFWRLYTATADALYDIRPLWTNRVGYVDLAETYQSVLYDLTISGVDPDIPDASPTPGGTLLEAEDADTNVTADKALAGFTGTGYLDLQGTEGTKSITWTYDAPHAGTYLLEFRHTQRWGSARIPAGLLINDQPHPDFALTHSGTSRNWVWDRATVTLQQGPNTISLIPGGSPRIDHLNVIDTGY